MLIRESLLIYRAGTECLLQAKTQRGFQGAADRMFRVNSSLLPHSGLVAGLLLS